MQNTSQILMSLGGILLLGLATDQLGRRTFLPRVTLLLIFGIIIGPEVLNLIPDVVTNYFELAANIALLMIGFLLGGKLTRDSFSNRTGRILWISVSAATGTCLVVFLALIGISVPWEIAILLGCIASATAPAATVDTVMSSSYQGPFSELLLSIVALDDAWALILFSLGIALVTSMYETGNATAHLWLALWDIGGAVLLGLVTGLPAAYLTGRIRPGQPMLTEALGLVFVCGGLALWLNVSFLIASMAMGAVIANLARHHEYPFHEIENIEWPFMVIFFVLAGALLEFGLVLEIGLIGLVYILSRMAGKILGANIGCRFSDCEETTRHWIGAAMFTQAGAATGMALVAANHFPQFRQILLPVVISSTVFFELLGPIFTRTALQQIAKKSR